MVRRFRAGLVLLAAALAAAGPAQGQGIVKKMKERARQQAEGRANRAADEAVDSAASAMEKAARCLISDAQCIKAAQEAGQAVLVTGPDGQPVSSEDSAAAIAAAGGAPEMLPPFSPESTPPQEPYAADGMGVPLDPAPAESASTAAAPAVPATDPPGVIAAVDFGGDSLGAAPGGIEINRGTFTVEEHETEAGRWLTGKERGGGTFFVPLPQALPADFTLTFDMIGRGGFIGVHPSGDPRGAHAMVEASGLGFIHDGAKTTKGIGIPDRKRGVVHHVRVVGRDSSLTLYIDGTRVAEAASAELARRGRRVAFGMSVYGAPERIGAIRVVEGAE